MLLNFAYAQTEQPNLQPSQTPAPSEQEKQEAKPGTGSIENPFNYGPYKGDEYIHLDRARLEKAESKEQREEEEANESQI